ncbi:nck-associated protein 5-like [Branchiostoma floridae]|uniref:Nck-associated protein 5-like n=1 Tax=Branchiostoma floridae TaxID=7739 RepID=A0A9J7KJ12_BRAFL|nr:nck-associated protein 5-like [Branchiostoma floridae]
MFRGVFKSCVSAKSSAYKNFVHIEPSAFVGPCQDMEDFWLPPEGERSGREDGPTERRKRPSGEREQENEQKEDRNSEKSKSSRETADSNQSYQECMEKRVEELTQQLQEERAVSRREKLTVARLQREVARNKSEGPMREKLMRDLDLERTRREETEQKLRDVSADNEQCKTRLQSLQQDMQHMEEQVQGMVQLKQKMDQLKRERGHLIDAYENQMDSIRTHVSNLELENDDLVKKVNNYESLSDVHLSSAEEEREKTVLLMQRLKSLEAENSALVLENENQREQYERCLDERLKSLEAENSALVLENENQREQFERCLDEVANQVVQALMAQKECLKLRNRVYDLEQQNKQLSVMFERRTSRFSSDSILQSAKRLRQRSFGGESKADTASLDSSNHSLPVQPQRFSPSPHSGLPVSQHQRATSYSPSTFVSSRKSGSVPNGSAGETSPHSSLSSMASDYSAHSSNHNTRNCRSTPPPPLIYSVQRHHPTYSRSQSDPSQHARQQFKEDKIIERINQLRAQVASNSNGLGESMLVPYTSKQDMRGSNEGIYSPGSSRKSGLFESEGQNYDYHPHNRLSVKCHPPQIRVQGSEGKGQGREVHV